MRNIFNQINIKQIINFVIRINIKVNNIILAQIGTRISKIRKRKDSNLVFALLQKRTTT